MTEKQLREKAVDTAKAWLGCGESNGTHKPIIDLYNSVNPLPRGYKVRYEDAWCAVFVSAVGIAAGMSDIIPRECGCGFMIELYKAAGRWQENDAYVPGTGDVVFYDWQDGGVGDDVGYPEHVGMVCGSSGTTIQVIEGNNKNNAVGYRDLQVDGRYVRGYGVPDYAGKAAEEGAASEKEASEKEASEKEESKQAESEKEIPKKTVAEAAEEVIQGKWGNGADRKTRLQAAGYSYGEVQAAVNEKLGFGIPAVYTVVKGDTLGAVAKKYHTTVASLASLNHIKDVDIINIGQVLRLR